MMQFFTNPVILMNADSGGGGGAPSDDKGKADDKDKGKADEKRSFTQAELDALFAERAKHAASKATADLLTALGAKDAEELKAKIEAAKKLEEAQLSELDKAKKRADELQAQLDAEAKARAEAVATANQKLLRAAVLAQAAELGFNDANDAWMYVDRASIKLDGENFTGVKEAVEAVAKAKAYLLKPTTTTRATGTPPPNGRRVAGEKKVEPVRIQF
jgi:hypothetical protein